MTTDRNRPSTHTATRRTTRADRTRPGTGPARGRRPYRRLRLVDAENLVGHGHVTLEELTLARRSLDAAVPTGPHDHTVVGVDKGNVLGACLAWAGSKVVFGTGPDGADLALLDCSDPAWIADRYDEVVIASGDHAFHPLASSLCACGVHVTVVARSGHISADLYKAAHAFCPLPILIDLTQDGSEVVTG